MPPPAAAIILDFDPADAPVNQVALPSLLRLRSAL